MSAPSASLRAATSAADEQQQTLAMLLRALKLPAFAARHEELARRAGQEGWTCPHYLRQLWWTLPALPAPHRRPRSSSGAVTDLIR